MFLLASTAANHAAFLKHMPEKNLLRNERQRPSTRTERRSWRADCVITIGTIDGGRRRRLGRQNLFRMNRFAEAFPDEEIVSSLMAQFEKKLHAGLPLLGIESSAESRFSIYEEFT